MAASARSRLQKVRVRVVRVDDHAAAVRRARRARAEARGAPEHRKSRTGSAPPFSRVCLFHAQCSEELSMLREEFRRICVHVSTNIFEKQGVKRV